MAQEAQNNPYYDEKFYHWGFQIGAAYTSLGVSDSKIPVEYMNNHGITRSDTIHVRAYNPGFGFHVNLINDLRLCKYLSLRINPGLEFMFTTLRYNSVLGDTIAGDYSAASGYGNGNDQKILRLPFTLPIYLKFAAERQGNYRPYVLLGGGVSYNINFLAEKGQTDQKVKFSDFDYFCEIGFGFDFYFPKFKGCPEITYRLGFNEDQIYKGNIQTGHEVFNIPIKKAINQAIFLTFNFE